MSRKQKLTVARSLIHSISLADVWILAIVNELLIDPRRFSELRDALIGISSNMLAQRLAQLEDAQIITRRNLAARSNVWMYQLTEWGREREAVLETLGQWSAMKGNWGGPQLAAPPLSHPKDSGRSGL
jgi:DNA-binding HxlR family transcriptional regulator